MGKRTIYISILFTLCILASNYTFAQTTERVAYVNSAELLESVPENVTAKKKINELNKKYKDELKVMQSDYSKKYSDFITDQNSMAESIKLRRMQELYELEKSINAFMQVAQKDIEMQEQLLLEPLRQKLREAINEIGNEYGFICIYDLSNPAIAFVTPMATDANTLVKRRLTDKIKTQ